MPESRPTLRELTAMRDKAAEHIASYARPGDPYLGALEAVQQLYELARYGIAMPTPDDVTWSILNDPACHAAYSRGVEHCKRGMVGSRLVG